MRYNFYGLANKEAFWYSVYISERSYESELLRRKMAFKSLERFANSEFGDGNWHFTRFNVDNGPVFDEGEFYVKEIE